MALRQQVFERNSVFNEFLATGIMKNKHLKQLLFYNSLKYSNESPRGKELRLLNTNPNLQNMNLSNILNSKLKK